jgi:acyl-coenzyme A synthetase/AMP-(fatty) acid ligase
VICWPTNLGWIVGPMILYSALLNGATLALYNGSPLGRGFGKFVQVINQLSLKINIFHSLFKVFPLCYFAVQALMTYKEVP